MSERGRKSHILPKRLESCIRWSGSSPISLINESERDKTWKYPVKTCLNLMKVYSNIILETLPKKHVRWSRNNPIMIHNAPITPHVTLSQVFVQKSNNIHDPSLLDILKSRTMTMTMLFSINCHCGVQLVFRIEFLFVFHFLYALLNCHVFETLNAASLSFWRDRPLSASRELGSFRLSSICWWKEIQML